jgi:hypothetical protein
MKREPAFRRSAGLPTQFIEDEAIKQKGPAVNWIPTGPEGFTIEILNMRIFF